MRGRSTKADWLLRFAVQCTDECSALGEIWFQALPFRRPSLTRSRHPKRIDWVVVCVGVRRRLRVAHLFPISRLCTTAGHRFSVDRYQLQSIAHTDMVSSSVHLRGQCVGWWRWRRRRNGGWCPGTGQMLDIRRWTSVSVRSKRVGRQMR